jgi:hypothetical protein
MEELAARLKASEAKNKELEASVQSVRIPFALSR